MGSDDNPGREKLPLVAVTGTNTLLLSAYLDLRNSWQEVRVISVVLRSEQAAYRCLLCCQGQLHITTGYAHVHEDHFGFDYGTADIFCSLPAGCPDPSHVAPIRDDFAHNFTVCLSTMFNFSNVLQLVQSMEMLRLLGVSRVVVYKTSCSADTQKLLDYYEHTGFMEIIPWTVSGRLLVSWGWRPEVSPGQLHYHGQIPALNDCVYRYMYRTRYLGLHDMDEIILPQTVDSWNEMLPLLESLHGADRGFMFENFVFPTSVGGVDILQHLHHEPPDALTFTNVKVVVDPRSSRSSTDGDAFHGPKVTADSSPASRLPSALSWRPTSSSVRRTEIRMLEWRLAMASARAMRIRTWLDRTETQRWG
ncbi:hypothetical protein CRUP_036502 [Coryphaenoides rupestris]|nr:hypothetical protein CRUP_036502 [Coryphaenoides rupestris]